jgi:hypothetical protein
VELQLHAFLTSALDGGNFKSHTILKLQPLKSQKGRDDDDDDDDIVHNIKKSRGVRTQ